MLNILISHKEEEYDLEKFWKIEWLGITPQVKENTQKEHLENFISINISYDDTKYNAKLPWKEDHTPLPSNIEITRRRTDNVIRRLSDDQYLLHKYGDMIFVTLCQPGLG
jgi:allophanate hydrolase subunit 1